MGEEQKDNECDGSLTQALTAGDANIKEMALQVFDAVAALPPRVQHIMALKAFGWSNAAIAKELGYKDSRWIGRLLDRWDPNRISERGDAVRRMVLCNMAERVAFESLRSIKVEDFKDMTVQDRVRVAKDAAKIVEELKAKAITPDANEEKLILDIKSWVTDQGGKQIIDVEVDQKTEGDVVGGEGCEGMDGAALSDGDEQEGDTNE